MIKHPIVSVIAVAAATVVIGTLAASPAMARGGPGGGGGGGGGGGRPCGQANFASGNGSLGSAWTIKSQYDDDAGLQVGEEFEVNDNVVGEVWTLNFSYNGTVFKTIDVAATSTGVRDAERASYTGGPSTVSMNAVNQSTGETVTGSVTDPVIPSACGQR